MMTKDMKDLLRILNAHAVKYLVVGGYAYGVHMEPRATKDHGPLHSSQMKKTAKPSFMRLPNSVCPLKA